MQYYMVAHAITRIAVPVRQHHTNKSVKRVRKNRAAVYRKIQKLKEEIRKKNELSIDTE